MKKLLLCILVLAGCSPSASNVYDTTSQATTNTSTIEVHWIDKDNISETCAKLGAADSPSGSYNACARSKPDNIHICEIYAVQPLNFDDTNRLSVFGHESWHCLGAKHK